MNRVDKNWAHFIFKLKDQSISCNRKLDILKLIKIFWPILCMSKDIFGIFEPIWQKLGPLYYQIKNSKGQGIALLSGSLNRNETFQKSNQNLKKNRNMYRNSLPDSAKSLFLKNQCANFFLKSMKWCHNYISFMTSSYFSKIWYMYFEIKFWYFWTELTKIGPF